MYTMMFLYLICSVIYIFIGVVTYSKNKKDPMNRTFLVICIALFFWGFCLALMSATTDPKIATFFRVISTFSWSFIYALFLLFTLFLTEKIHYMKSLLHYILLFVPAFVSIYLYLFDPVTPIDIVKIPIGWAFLNPVGKGVLWDVFFNIYYMTYMGIVCLLLIIWLIKSTLKRHKLQGEIILSTLVLSIILGSVLDILLPLKGITLVPPLTIFITMTLISGIAYSVNKYSLMTMTNEKVVSDVFKIMNEGIIVLDYNYKISGINKGALNMLKYEEEDLLNKQTEILFEEGNILEKFSNGSSCEIDILMKSNSTIPVLASFSTLLDNFGEHIGNLLILQDLTNYRKIQDELRSAYDDLEVKVHERTRELSMVNAKLGVEIETRIENERQIEYLAYNDQLTGLPNRRYFNLQLENNIKKSELTGSIFAVLFLDLDGFKMINDTLGHDQGDKLLKGVAKRLTRLFRKNDLIARVGGDEFIILINEISDIDDVKKICENTVNEFEKPFKLSIGDIYSTTSIGVALYPYDGLSLETLVKNADISMYKAKESGKGKFIFYDSTMLENLDKTLSLTNDLHKAIERNELEVYYQPQNCTFTGEIVGVEALIRWNHPKFGILNSSDFIPIAERTGLIVEIGEWVLDQACSDFMKLRNNHLNLKSIAVNLSVNQLVSYSLIKKVKEILKKNGMAAKFLELEVTESVLLNDTKYIFKILNDLKKLNVRIAVDDFGTDYSSLRYLKQLPLDRIKIAKNFIDGIGENVTDESIIATIILLGKKLKLNLIAEGVEHQNQVEFLKELKCEEIQGYYFYKPMKYCDIELLLSETKKEKTIQLLAT